MESAQTADSLARLAVTLQAGPEQAADVAIARHILASTAMARASTATFEGVSMPSISLPSEAGLTAALAAGVRVSDALIAAMQATPQAAPDALTREIQQIIAAGAPSAARDLGELENYDFAIRRTPIRTDISALSVPVEVVGRSVARTLGPFLDPSGLCSAPLSAIPASKNSSTTRWGRRAAGRGCLSSASNSLATARAPSPHGRTPTPS